MFAVLWIRLVTNLPDAIILIFPVQSVNTHVIWRRASEMYGRLAIPVFSFIGLSRTVKEMGGSCDV
jgi:hypothetical protein